MNYFWLILFCFASQAVAGSFVTEAKPIELPRPPSHVIFVPVVKEAPLLDGKLTEPMWKNAAVIHQWIDRGSQSEAPIQAELRIATDEKNLYVGFDVKVADASKLPFKKPDNGDEHDGRNSLELFLDPSGRGKEKYQMVVNPLGLRYDGRNGEKTWQGKWLAKGDVRSNGWSVEFVIPEEDIGRDKLRRGNRWKGNFGYNSPEEANISWTGKWGTPGDDYGVLFFGTPEEYSRSVTRSISLWLDREVYDLRDITAVGLVRLDAVNQPNSGTTTHLRLLRDGKEISSDELKPELGADVDLTLDIKSLSAGVYQLVAEIQQDGKAIATATENFKKEKRKLIPTGPTKGRIPIRTWAEADAAGNRWPVNTGVPFAQDALWSAENVRLLGPDGKEVPCQTAVRSTWNRNGSVQWLGVDFVPTLAADGKEYILEYGPKVRRKATTPLRCEESPDVIAVTTGPLKFTVSRKQFRLIESAFLDANGDGRFQTDEQVIKPSEAGGLFLIDHEGDRYEAAFDRDANVVVEEKGPVRVTVRAEGWYVKRGSEGKRVSCELPTDKLCKFTVRLSAYAGEPMLRMAMSSVVSYDSTKVRLRDLGLALVPADAQGVTIATENNQSLSWDSARLKQNPHLLQHRWDKSVDDQLKEHSRVMGSVQATGPKADMVIAVRNFWKLFPKEIEWRDGALNLHIWPAHGREVFPMEEQLKWPNIYKLWYAHQGRELDFTFPTTYSRALDDELKRNPKAFSPYYQEAPKANAQGMSIHNEFTILFRSRAAKKAIDAKTLSHLTDTNPHAFPYPAYVCATGVFGPMLHQTDEFAPIETAMRRGFESISSRALPNHEYGMFVFGGEHTYWNYTTSPPHAGVHRVWINGHYSIVRAPFIEYARSGNPSYLLWGRNFADNLRDIAMVHYTSTERQFPYHQLGAMYHCKGFLPWGGDSGVAFHMSVYDFLIYDYYLTGNRRSLDAVRTWVQGIKTLSPGGWGTREGTTPLAEMVEAYRLTWDAGLIELMDRFDKRVFEPTSLSESNFWAWYPLLLSRYWLLTGSDRAVQAFRPFTGQRRALSLDAFFALLDGKPDGLKRWQPILYADSVSYINQPGLYADGHVSHSWEDFIYPMHMLPYALKAMKEFGLRPERPTMTAQNRLPVAVQQKQSLVAVRESSDSAIPVKVEFAATPSGKVGVEVYRADKTQIVRQEWMPAKDQKLFEFMIPADSKATDYLISLTFNDSYDAPFWPVTKLPKEVVILRGPTQILTGSEGQRFYFVPGTNGPSQAGITSNSKRTAGFELLDANQSVLARGADSRYVRAPAKLTVPTNAPTPLSIFCSDEIDLDCAAGHEVIVAPTPEALFTPTITEKP